MFASFGHSYSDMLVTVGLLPIRSSCKQEDYPLVNATVHYDISDVQMLANLVQTYSSNAKVDSEIRYVFPLPPDASVCAFKAVIDGERTIKGIVKEKAAAKAQYDKAISQGQTAALLEQGNVEIFQVSLGNIRPKQIIEVHISFVSIVSHDGSLDSLRMTFPSIIAPRYGTPPSDIASFHGANQQKGILELSAAVEMTSHINSITSPSHPIAVQLGQSTVESSNEFEPNKARVSFSSQALLEKDIVVVLSCQGLDRPRCMVESFSPEEGAQEHTRGYALTLVPRFDPPQLSAQEYIFLVDRSGSMSGRKMDAVRSALQILLASLPSRGTTFNILSFGTRHSFLWRSSVTYSPKSVKKASHHVDKMKADHGGTQTRQAIEKAFSRRVAPGNRVTSTSVFILTDGEAYDLDGVKHTIQTAVSNAKKVGLLLRLFCMGIGDAVSKEMCDVMARTGRGAAVFVGEEEKPDQKLMALLRAARGDVVDDVSIDWGVGEEDSSEADDKDFEMVPAPEYSPTPEKSVAPIPLFDESHTVSTKKVDLGPQSVSVTLPPPPRIQQAPLSSSLPPLYPGFRTSLFAIVRNGKNTPPATCVRVKGTVRGQPVALEVPVAHTSKPKEQMKSIHLLAARSLIQSIEDRCAGKMSDVDKAEVVRLAERYGLASSQTSFIAVDEHGKTIDIYSLPQTPSPKDGRSLRLSGLGGGWGSPSENNRACLLMDGNTQPDIFSASLVGVPPQAGSAPVQAALLSTRSKRRSTLPEAPKVAKMFGFGRGGRSKKELDSSAPLSGSSNTQSPSIEMFARAQSFDGSFTGSPDLFQVLVHKSQAPAMPPGLKGDSTVKMETAWCTVLCVVYLETKLMEDKDIWMLLVEKATNFLEDVIRASNPDKVTERLQELKEAAGKYIA